MRDLREKVKDERTFLKKIELAIPGFRGYRKREDLRIADSMLRDYIANKLQESARYIQRVREFLTENMALEDMNMIGKIMNRTNTFEERIRHAEQGYMGLVGDYRVDVDQLNNLYEFDLKLIEKSQNILEYAKKMATSQNLNEVRTMMKELWSMLESLEDLFEKRRNSMLEVFE